MTEYVSDDTVTSALQGDRDAVQQMALRARVSEEVVNAALVGNPQAIRQLTAALNGEATPEQAAYQAGVAVGAGRADLYEALREFREKYGDLEEDPTLWEEVVRGDTDLAQRYPRASAAQRLEALGETAHRLHGKPEQRVILAMENQRRRAQGLPPRTFEPPEVEKPDEDEAELAKENAAWFESQRQGRTGNNTIDPETRRKALAAIALQKRRQAAGG